LEEQGGDNTNTPQDAEGALCFLKKKGSKEGARYLTNKGKGLFSSQKGKKKRRGKTTKKLLLPLFTGGKRNGGRSQTSGKGEYGAMG